MLPPFAPKPKSEDVEKVQERIEVFCYI